MNEASETLVWCGVLILVGAVILLVVGVVFWAWVAWVAALEIGGLALLVEWVVRKKRVKGEGD